eukprot:2268259-Rhodomonas_salina.1
MQIEQKQAPAAAPPAWPTSGPNAAATGTQDSFPGSAEPSPARRHRATLFRQHHFLSCQYGAAADSSLLCHVRPGHCIARYNSLFPGSQTLTLSY